MKTFYFCKNIGQGVVCLMLVSCGVASVVAPCLSSNEGLAIMESLNDKLVFACEVLNRNK